MKYKVFIPTSLALSHSHAPQTTKQFLVVFLVVIAFTLIYQFYVSLTLHYKR